MSSSPRRRDGASRSTRRIAGISYREERHIMQEQFWGWIMIAIGLIVAIFGARAFRLGLAIAGFAGGFLLAFFLLGNYPSLNHVLISLVGGAVGAALGMTLVKFSNHLAGALLGLAVGLLIVGALGLSAGGGLSHTIGVILALAGLIGGGLIGPWLGVNALLLASAGLGSLLIVAGLQTTFGPQLGENADTVRKILAGPLSLTLFVILFLLAALGQIDFGGFGAPAKSGKR
ncbi:MAG: hypothetical protein ACR2J8_11730 [Thermomicrobiales bacterium]